MMTDLDNPIWHALNSANAALGSGTDDVKLFNFDVAPFAGLKSDTPENFQALYKLIEADRTIVLFSPKPDLDHLPFQLEVKVPGYQMVFEDKPPEPDTVNKLSTLTEKDVPDMLALTQLAQPGPFFKRTIDFGGYQGVFDGDKLIAMGGQRLQGNGYTEISAVCTHPEYTGKGYGRQIMLALVYNIISSGNQAYLHVRKDNIGAVSLYEKLGFVIRTDMYFYVLRK